MTYTSDRPITVDGTRLDTLAWNIEDIQRQVASRRSLDQEVPGVDGAIPSLNDNLEPVTYGLSMFVMGTDADGVIPAAGRRDTFLANLDELIHLFGKRHALLDLQAQVNATETRRAYAKVVDTISPEVNLPGSAGRFTAGLVIPAGSWEDLAPVDGPALTGWDTAPTKAIAGLQGATVRSTDTIFVLKGPATNPRVTDYRTGAYVQLNQALSSSQYWRVNVKTWSSRTQATPLTLDSSDATGTDATSTTVFGGTRNQAAFLPLVPVRDPGGTAVRTNLFTDPGNESAGATGWSGGTRDNTKAHSGTWSRLGPVGGAAYQSVLGLPANTTYTASAWVWIPSSTTGTVTPRVGSTAVAAAFNGPTITARDQWVRSSMTFTTDADGGTLAFYPAQGGAVGQYWMDDLLLETGSVLNDYFDGDSYGCGWTGVAQQSTSVVYSNPGLRQVKVTLSGTGITSATSLQFRTLRRFAL